MESTAFGTRVIVEALEAAGLPVTEFIAAGGLKRNRALMQIYADVLRRPVSVASSDQAPALGSAIHAAVAAGLHPDVDVEIRFTGLRPGEKLHEELFHGQEPPVPTGQPGLLIAAPRTADPAIVGRAIDEIAAACRGGQTRLALALLGRLVPEFAYKADAADEVRA
jgi:hypothetical protein